jgi:hypothetical protein
LIFNPAHTLEELEFLGVTQLERLAAGRATHCWSSGEGRSRPLYQRPTARARKVHRVAHQVSVEGHSSTYRAAFLNLAKTTN